MIKVIRTIFFLRRSAYRAYLNCLSHSWKYYDWKSELHCRWPRFWPCHDLCLDFDQRERNRNQFQHFTDDIRKQVIPLDNSGLLLFSESSESLFKSPLTFISMVFSSSSTQTCTTRGSSVLDTQNYTGGSWNNSVLCCKLTDPKTGRVVKEDCKKMYTLPGENTIENNNTHCGYVYLKRKIQIDWSACSSLLFSPSLLLVPWSFFATSTFVFCYLYILYTRKTRGHTNTLVVQGSVDT